MRVIMTSLSFLLVPIFLTNAYAWDQEYESDTRLNDIEQYNKDGDNYIVVQTKQEGLLDKITNKAEQLLWGDSYVSRDEYDGKNNEYYYDKDYYEPKVKTKKQLYHDRGYNDYDERTITVKLISTGDLNHEDYRVKVQAQTEVIDEEEFEDDGRAKATFNVDYYDGEVSVCVAPADDINDRECKETSKSTVTFYVK